MLSELERGEVTIAAFRSVVEGDGIRRYRYRCSSTADSYRCKLSDRHGMAAWSTQLSVKVRSSGCHNQGHLSL